METQPSTKGRLVRLLRTLHAWLGIFVFPWVIMIGATGFYLNHQNAVLPLLPAATFDERQFDAPPGASPLTEAAAQAVAARVWPDEPVTRSEPVDYHGHDAWSFQKPSGRIVVLLPTGHYLVTTSLVRRIYAPGGTLLSRQVAWGLLFRRLHVQGWADSSLGTWLADLTSLAMVIFGLSGVVLWWSPRWRRFRRALGRLRGAPPPRGPAPGGR